MDTGFVFRVKTLVVQKKGIRILLGVKKKMKDRRQYQE